MTDTFDIAIIGAGMAGASLAAECAEHASIVLLEAEERPGYHATGRSAAFWEECYGGPDIVPLTLASGAYLREHGMLSKRGALYIGRKEDDARFDRFVRRFTGSGATFERIGRDALEGHILGLKREWVQAIWQPDCADIDVAGLHQHYLAKAKRCGVELRCKARVGQAARDGDTWRLSYPGGEIAAKVVVDAAGAWADTIAALCGVEPLGITPYRRTVAQLRTDPAPNPDMPLALDISGGFYFKPESGKFWLSPHDETPSDPCDVAPEEIDVASAIDRFQQVVDCRIEAVEHKWAGLRSFSPDRAPVYGFDRRVDGFFWFAGQGGYGIQTAPAAARLASQLLLGLGRDPMTEALDAQLYSPARFTSP